MKNSAQWRNSAALYAAMLAPIAALAVYAKIVIAEAWSRADEGAAPAKQRTVTDAALDRVRGRILASEGAGGAQRTSALTAFFSGLDARRDAVDAFAITVPALAGEYTVAIRHLLSAADDRP